MARSRLPAVRGVRDVLPEETLNWRRAEDLAREVFTRYCYGEIRVPVFERTELFSRGIGEETDIVSKEMYTFTDKGGDSITLRPEATASICRAYVQNGLYHRSSVSKLFCIGPMFRYERPQAGRLRQFHQIDAEVFGTEDPAIDAEVIVMLMEFLGAMGLGGLALRINNLGDEECRPAYSAALKDYLWEEAKNLGPEIAGRIERNPLRFLDSKDPAHEEIIARAPRIDEFLNDACRSHLVGVCALLKGAGVRYQLDPRLVRGLDYYRLTVFEVTSERLGAQNAVCGGGRYDGLVEALGGPPTPALGFAVGMERLLQLAGERASAPTERIDVYVAALGDAARAEAFALASELRARGIQTERSFGGGSVKSQMKRADRLGARFVLLLGEDEAAKGVVSVRHMVESRQNEVKREEVVTYVKRFL